MQPLTRLASPFLGQSESLGKIDYRQCAKYKKPDFQGSCVTEVFAYHSKEITMNFWKKSLMAATALSLVVGAAGFNDAHAAKKKSSGAAKAKAVGTGDNALISSDPGAATVREARLLKWGAVDPPDRGKSPEYFVRGVVMNLEPIEGENRKDFYNINFLPIEVVENEYRVITFDNFTNGMKIPSFLPKDMKKQFKDGAVVEVHNYYTTKEEQAIGHAKMIAFSYHQDIIPYPAGPAAYIKKGGLDQEQYLNALKGMEIYGDNNKDSQLKTGLDALASSSPNVEVKNKATALLSSLFGAAPSGQALLPAEPATPAGEKVPKKKK